MSKVVTPAAILGLQQALTDLQKEFERLSQDLNVALNEANGRAGDIQQRMTDNRREVAQIDALIQSMLEEA